MEESVIDCIHINNWTTIIVYESYHLYKGISLSIHSYRIVSHHPTNRFTHANILSKATNTSHTHIEYTI